jgi:hypothetical protein
MELKMGLESHVDRILEEAGIPKGWYHWHNGMNIDAEYEGYEQEQAEKIMEILDKSGEIGPTRFDSETGKIDFGTHRSFFKSEKRYQNYVKDFKAFKRTSKL